MVTQARAPVAAAELVRSLQAYVRADKLAADVAETKVCLRADFSSTSGDHAQTGEVVFFSNVEDFYVLCEDTETLQTDQQGQ